MGTGTAAATAAGTRAAARRSRAARGPSTPGTSTPGATTAAARRAGPALGALLCRWLGGLSERPLPWLFFHERLNKCCAKPQCIMYAASFGTLRLSEVSRFCLFHVQKLDEGLFCDMVW
jgi:hypothetical protein